MRKLFLVAGDPSGDAHGAELIVALKREEPSLRIAAIGGALMRGQADEFMEDLASLGISGFVEPILRIPRLWRLRNRIKDHLRYEKIDSLICIDYYGFNRWVLQAAKDVGVPAYYYVSPQVWASRPHRVDVLKRLVKRMFVIFPFEEKLYREAGVPVTFVGHPLLDRLPQARRGGASTGASPDALRIGLLPGSRAGEVRRHLPLFLDALDRLRGEFPRLKAFVFAAPSLADSYYADAAKRGLRPIRESDYGARSTLDFALCSSGTATLENALLGIPSVVVYRMSRLTYEIARRLIRVPFISMANLLAGRALLPELIQENASADSIADAARRLLRDPRSLERLREELASLRGLLGDSQASSRAARAILREMDVLALSPRAATSAQRPGIASPAATR